MDCLSEVIGTYRVGTAASRVTGHSGSPGIRFPAFVGSGFHVLLAGTCWLVGEGKEPVVLRPGDVVLVPSGAEHALTRTPCALSEVPPAVRPTNPVPRRPVDFEFLCGSYHLTHGSVPRYLRTLPDLITFSPDYDRHPELRTLISLLASDASAGPMGTGATVPALLDLILVHVLRQWHETSGTPQWLGVDDPLIAVALRNLHEDLRHPWSVSQLSEAAGMSRTAFTRRFTTLVGRPPMSYLISARLRRGAQLLRGTDASLATIARLVGYSTEFAFSSAFRREYGLSPSRFRRSPATVRGAEATSSGFCACPVSAAHGVPFEAS